jgi:hypothetical protein
MYLTRTYSESKLQAVAAECKMLVKMLKTQTLSACLFDSKDKQPKSKMLTPRAEALPDTLSSFTSDTSIVCPWSYTNRISVGVFLEL